MKKIVHLFLLILTALQINGNIYDAINNASVVAVEKEIKGQIFTYQEKNKLLELADNNIKNLESITKLIIPDYEKILHLLGGSALFAASLGLMGFGISNLTKPKIDKTDSIFGISALCIGLPAAIQSIRYINKSLHMASIKTKLNNTIKIKKLIEDIKVN